MRPAAAPTQGSEPGFRPGSRFSPSTGSSNEYSGNVRPLPPTVPTGSVWINAPSSSSSSNSEADTDIGTTNEDAGDNANQESINIRESTGRDPLSHLPYAHLIRNGNIEPPVIRYTRRQRDGIYFAIYEDPRERQEYFDNLYQGNSLDYSSPSEDKENSDISIQRSGSGRRSRLGLEPGSGSGSGHESEYEYESELRYVSDSESGFGNASRSGSGSELESEHRSRSGSESGSGSDSDVEMGDGSQSDGSQSQDDSRQEDENEDSVDSDGDIDLDAENMESCSTVSEEFISEESINNESASDEPSDDDSMAAPVPTVHPYLSATDRGLPSAELLREAESFRSFR